MLKPDLGVLNIAFDNLYLCALIKNYREAIPLMKQAFEMAAGDDGWAHFGAVGNHLRELNPCFDPRTYGYKQLSQLFKACPKLFELKHDQDSTVFYVRLKE